MAFLNHNVTGEITKELLAVGENIDLSSISLCNVHATLACTVDLYIEKKLTPGKTSDASFAFNNGKFGSNDASPDINPVAAVDIVIT